MRTIKNIVGIYIVTLITAFLFFGIISLIKSKVYFSHPQMFSTLIEFETIIEFFLLFIFPLYMGCIIKFRFFKWVGKQIIFFELIQKNDYVCIILNIISIVLNSIVPFVIVLIIWLMTSFNTSMYIVD